MSRIFDIEDDNWDPTRETHEQWRRRRALDGQRYRRSTLRRIDYQDVSPEAAKIIDSLRRPYAGGDASSILNRIVVEWWELRKGRKEADLPE